MRFMRSAQRQVKLRRLGNQIPMLGKANSLCKVGNIIISLQPWTSMILKLCRPLFRNTISQFDRVMYLFVKVWVFCLLFCQLRPLVVGKHTNSRFLRFFVRSVPLFSWLMLTPMMLVHHYKQEKTLKVDEINEELGMLAVAYMWLGTHVYACRRLHEERLTPTDSSSASIVAYVTRGTSLRHERGSLLSERE